MNVWWLSKNNPPEGVDFARAAALSQTGRGDLVFVEGPKAPRARDASGRRMYLVCDGNPPARIPRHVMGVLPKDASVLNAMAQLYREMRQSFELGDMLITSLGEKDQQIKHNRRQLLANSRRYNAIVQNANDIIFIVGRTGRITFCNEKFTRCLAVGGTSPVGTSITRYAVEEDRSELGKALARGFDECAPVRLEVRMPLASGRVGILSLLFTPLVEEGRAYALSVIGRDVTELRAMQKRLAIQAGDLSQMMNGLAHELRNPLTVIGAYVRRLVRSPGEDKRKWDEALSGIYSSIGRIEAMIERVEAYERLVGMDAACVPLDLEKLVTSTVAEAGAGIPVEIDAQSDVRALGDEEHVRTALVRILENALQTSTPKVVVKVWHDDAYAYVSVRDFGPGVKDKVQTILSPFYSTDPMKIGLGLTEARIAMVKIRGDLEVVRQAGPGAVFTLKLLLDMRKSERPERS